MPGCDRMQAGPVINHKNSPLCLSQNSQARAKNSIMPHVVFILIMTKHNYKYLHGRSSSCSRTMEAIQVKPDGFCCTAKPCRTNLGETWSIQKWPVSVRRLVRTRNMARIYLSNMRLFIKQMEWLSMARWNACLWVIDRRVNSDSHSAKRERKGGRREINGEMNKKCSTLHISVSMYVCPFSADVWPLEMFCCQPNPRTSIALAGQNNGAHLKHLDLAISPCFG